MCNLLQKQTDRDRGTAWGLLWVLWHSFWRIIALQSIFIFIETSGRVVLPLFLRWYLDWLISEEGADRGWAIAGGVIGINAIPFVSQHRHLW